MEEIDIAKRPTIMIWIRILSNIIKGSPLYIHVTKCCGHGRACLIIWLPKRDQKLVGQ